MSKELFVSLTPHETKVAVTEDDQLAEIYFERENEYTLAGSIYKGRVTRVLPGMQSAFVDIGLERDAFLYVSDFLDLEDEGEDIEPVKIQGQRTEGPVSERAEKPARHERYQREENRPAGQDYAEEQADSAPPDDGVPSPIVFEGPEPTEAAAAAPPETRLEDEQRDERGGWRRRRRRGRRGRGFPDDKFAQPAEETREPRRDRESYGPPPGYQPIILPGESISKYQRYAQPAVPVDQEHISEHQTTAEHQQPDATEPDGGAPAHAIEVPGAAPGEAQEPPVLAPASFQQEYPETPLTPKAEERAREQEGSPSAAPPQSAERDDVERYDRMNVAGIFGGVEATRAPEPSEISEPVMDEEVVEEHRAPETASAEHNVESAESEQPGESAEDVQDIQRPSIRAFEEEEIDEEESELPALTEALGDGDEYEELEEETLEPEGAPDTAGEALTESVEEAEEEREAIEAYEGEEENGEVMEEADAEEEGEMTRAELRGPSATAGYQQRTQRPAFDRHRGRRGGRRMRQRTMQRHQVQIADVLKEGQEILVQIAKEPIGKKGARITSHIALPGRFMVYMPTVNHMGVSRKIASDEERQRLRRIVMNERNGHGGFIVRTAAEGVSEEELLADIRFLKSLWSEIRTRAENAKPPSLIYHDLNVVERTLRDLLNEDFTHVWVDNEQEYERVLRFVNRFQPNLVRRVRLYTKDTPLFEQFGVQDEINKALKSKVWLKSGGYIVINQTEALVAIDVNTGKYVGKTTRLEDTIVKTNVDAIKEIVRQIRLRDLGGIIVIDFIDMDERKNRQRVMQALEEALKNDRAPSKVLQFNDFGLVAITRKRVKHSLERTLGQPCPVCSGTGLVKSVETVCNEIYVEMKKLRRHLEGREILLRVNPEVAKALKGNNARWLTDMEELTGKTIIVKSDATLHPEQFDM